MAKNRTVSIKYTSREFSTIKRDLVEYAKRYYPDSFRDFNEASFGALMLDSVSYIGDILSYYVDHQANEIYLDTAQEYSNVLKIGAQMGYKHDVTQSSVGIAAFYLMIPALESGVGPDYRYIPVLKKGSTFSSTSDALYTLSEDVHFGENQAEIRVARVDPVTGDPLFYVVKSYGQVVSGLDDYEFYTVGPYSKFKKVLLEQLDISEILSVQDSEGNEYFEVDYLSQNVIYKGVTNRNVTTGSEGQQYTGAQASEILKPVVVPRRFVVQKLGRETVLVFGASSDADVPDDFISEPQSAVLEKHGRDYIQDVSFDPTRLIESDKFGVAPSNTVLTISYRSNNSTNVNCSVGNLKTVVIYDFEFMNRGELDDGFVDIVESSLEVDNEQPIIGSITVPNAEELKHRIRGVYPTQNRAVTQQDYESMVYQMPPRFGSVKRCRMCRDNDSLKRNLNLYLISEGVDGSLTESNDVIKNNVRTWLQKSKMMNDTIDILPARVVNLKIDFVATGVMSSSKYDILQQAKIVLRDYFVRKPDIGEPFMVVDIYRELRKVESIVDVVDVKVHHVSGVDSNRSYSDITFDVDRAMSADGRYIEMPKNVIYEVKFPGFDINGVIL